MAHHYHEANRNHSLLKYDVARCSLSWTDERRGECEMEGKDLIPPWETRRKFQEGEVETWRRKLKWRTKSVDWRRGTESGHDECDVS
jgi:hypothetical protein